MATPSETPRPAALPPDTRATERSGGKRRPLILLLVLALGAAGYYGYRQFFTHRAPAGIIELSGRIEGDQAKLAPRISGRILEIKVREGDSVNANDEIAVLDDDQVRAREAAARAALAQAEARAAGVRGQIAVLREQLLQTQLQTEQAKVDSGGRVRQAEAELAAAEAQLAQQEASYQLALFDKEAYTRLAQSGAVSERQGKQAVSTADQQASAVASAQRRVEAAQGALATARANLANPNIRAAEVAGVQRQLAQQNAEVMSAMALIEQARAQLEEAQANRHDLIIRAPFAGTVVTRAAEPGEIVTAGTPIVTLVDLAAVYLRGYVPEGQIGAVKAGQPARIFLDSSPEAAIDAIVSRIDPQATFTPENTYFRDDRVKQVVGVKLLVKGAIGFAKPGMPADGEILVSGSGSWPQTGPRP
ncbi:MAG: HlyD family efflux transporter periplasmic adaptor subunit [Acidimicrobiia bacterium]|nr:HlyD family efflux transporter periplasmic adaptor subunit [Acidimicrobiia bacterium]